jgi:sec-independent protein translocase protein TatA
MPNIGLPELIIIFVIILLLFGAKKIPEIGASIGKGIKEFKNSMKEGMEDEEKKKVTENTDKIGKK